MEKFSTEATVRALLQKATGGSSGRAAQTLYGGHETSLRQTVVALTSGSSLAEHESPGEATLLVLHGRVRLVAGDVTWDGRPGDLLVIPPARHSLEADTDAAVLLTVATKS